LKASRLALGLGLGCIAALACASPAPESLGVREGQLAPCPSSPNCVSTEATDSSHRTDPFVLLVPPDRAWTAAREAVASLPGARVVSDDGDYLHAEVTSPLLGFVDDLELQLLPEARLAVRSASRTGWYDMGENRERVWELRRTLAARGVVP
jgi:uncharacterized protein (DUF1499 family)